MRGLGAILGALLQVEAIGLSSALALAWLVAVPNIVEDGGRQLGSEATAGKHRGVSLCTENRTQHCCGDGVCSGAEDQNNCLVDCPGVTTDAICGEEPHSDRSGRTLAFGVSHRAASAQQCCDRCRDHAAKGNSPPCNSWTFCGYPVCWGLDTGWNHTYGECWLRHLDGPVTFGQRGAYSDSYRQKMLHTRPKCIIDLPGGQSEGWSCPPTHVPWTSGSLGVKPDLSIKWQTSGGWGNMRIHRLAADGTPIESSCTRNGGQVCDPKVLGHAG